MRLAGALVALFFAYNVAEATILDVDPLDVIVRNADLVARVEIIGSRETACQTTDATRNCVFAYRAKVLAIYKGKAESLLFFSTKKLDESGYQEFLVAAMKQHTACESLSPLESSICAAEGQYAVYTTGYDTIIPIARRIVNGKQESFVVVNSPFSGPFPTDESFVRRFDDGIHAVPLSYIERSIGQWRTSPPAE